MRLAPAGDGAGRVERVLPFGAASRVIVTVDGARILAEAPAGAVPAEAGARVAVSIDPAAARRLT